MVAFHGFSPSKLVDQRFFFVSLLLTLPSKNQHFSNLSDEWSACQAVVGIQLTILCCRCVINAFFAAKMQRTVAAKSGIPRDLLQKPYGAQ